MLNLKNGLVFLIVILSSCLDLIDERTMQPLASEPNVGELIGKWEADSFTYEVIKKQKIYKLDSLSLILHANKTFEGKNFPDF